MNKGTQTDLIHEQCHLNIAGKEIEVLSRKTTELFNQMAEWKEKSSKEMAQLNKLLATQIKSQSIISKKLEDIHDMHRAERLQRAEHDKVTKVITRFARLPDRLQSIDEKLTEHSAYLLKQITQGDQLLTRQYPVDIRRPNDPGVCRIEVIHKKE